MARQKLPHNDVSKAVKNHTAQWAASTKEIRKKKDAVCASYDAQTSLNSVRTS